MRKKFYRYFFVTLAITCAILGFLSFYILKIADNARAREIAFEKIQQIDTVIDEKQSELDSVLKQFNNDNLSKAKAISLVLNQSASSFETPESLESLRIAMDVEQIIITDADGIVENATTAFVGENLFLDDKYKPFQKAVSSKTFTLVQNDIVNNKILQYIGVSRLEKDGLVYVETVSNHLGDVIKLSGISTICKNEGIMLGGETFIINQNEWTYLSHTDDINVGEFVQIPKDKFKNIETSGTGSFKQKIQGKNKQIYYQTKGDYVVCVSIPTSSIFLTSKTATISVIVCVLITSFVIILAIRKKFTDINEK